MWCSFKRMQILRSSPVFRLRILVSPFCTCESGSIWFRESSAGQQRLKPSFQKQELCLRDTGRLKLYIYSCNFSKKDSDDSVTVVQHLRFSQCFPTSRKGLKYYVGFVIKTCKSWPALCKNCNYISDWNRENGSRPSQEVVLEWIRELWCGCHGELKFTLRAENLSDAWSYEWTSVSETRAESQTSVPLENHELFCCCFFCNFRGLKRDSKRLVSLQLKLRRLKLNMARHQYDHYRVLLYSNEST